MYKQGAIVRYEPASAVQAKGAMKSVSCFPPSSHLVHPSIAKNFKDSISSRKKTKRAGRKHFKPPLASPCNEETGKFFLKRLESRGWEDVREQLLSTKEEQFEEVWKAMNVVYGLGILETPLKPSPWLRDTVSRQIQDGSVRLKLENLQVTGSFKSRGAAYKISSLTENEWQRGLVTSSTGNHALAVLHACDSIGRAGQSVNIEIYLPRTTAPRKLSKIQRMAEKCNGKIILHGEDCIEAERKARQIAEARGQIYISPYNDLGVIAGQGTIGIEILMESSAEDLDYVFVPVGGGGLISGIASVLKAFHPKVKIIGCQPEASDVMRRSIEEGSVVSLPWCDTLSEGTAGGIEMDSITLDKCSNLVDDWVTVTEDEIAAAMVGMHGHHGVQIEGASAVAVAALVKYAPVVKGKHSVVIICGGNVSSESLDKAYDKVRGTFLEKKDVNSRNMKKGEAAAF